MTVNDFELLNRQLYTATLFFTNLHLTLLYQGLIVALIIARLIIPTATHAINTGSDLGLGDDIGAKQYNGIISTAKAELLVDAFLENGVGRNLDNSKIQNSLSRTRVSYFKFSVSGVNSKTVESALLKITCANDPGYGNLRVYLGSHNNWNEQSLAYSTPDKEALVDSINSVYTSGMEYVFDISSVISTDGEYTLVMSMDKGGNDVSFHSSEGTVPPVLEINIQ